jgi:hypothetical protein
MEVIYLDVFLMKKMCHPLAAEIFDHRTDPLPPFEQYSTEKLEASLHSPRQGFGGGRSFTQRCRKKPLFCFTH